MDDIFLMVMLAGLLMLGLRWLFAPVGMPMSRQQIRRTLEQQLLSTIQGLTLVAENDNSLSFEFARRPVNVQMGHLFRQCSEFPARTGFYVMQTVNAIQQALYDADELAESWLDKVFPVFAGAADAPLPEIIHTRDFLPALKIIYVVDIGEAYRWISREEMAAAGVDAEQLHTLALRNLERSCNTLVIESAFNTEDGPDQMLRFNTGDGFDAARVLIPSFYQRFSPRFDDADLLVAIPSRDTLIMQSADNTPQDFWLLGLAHQEHRRRAYPLLPTLLKVHENGIEPARIPDEPTYQPV